MDSADEFPLPNSLNLGKAATETEQVQFGIYLTSPL